MTTYNINCVDKETFPGVEFSVKRNGSPLNLTGASIELEVRQNYGSTPVLSFSIGSGITVTNLTGGAFKINEQTINCTPGRYIYDIEITLADATVHTWIQGEWTVVGTVTNG
jgi:hypothetical protein